MTAVAVSRGLVRVPQITALFWIIKGLSTAVGESTSDLLVHSIDPVVAVCLGFAGFVAALALQFRMRQFVAWSYWLAVVMVGIFGTMAADVLHVGFHVPYAVSSVFYAIALALVFWWWRKVESSLSIHGVDNARTEAFYWSAVVATFALGTAVGDLVAVTLHLGYLGSLILFGTLIAIPSLGYWRLHWNAVGCFWAAYVLTRPLGASLADWFGKPRAEHGLGVGSDLVTVTLLGIIAVLVGFLSIPHRRGQRVSDSAPETAVAGLATDR
jgi:uncharacterized membrane-anchored protein